MATMPFLDLTDLRDPSATAQERAAARVDDALRRAGAFLAVGHGIPSRIPHGGFGQVRLLFGLPASTRAGLRAEPGGRGFVDTGHLEAGDRFTLGRDLPAAHALVAAGTAGYGPNRWPPLHAFRDVMTAWQRAVTDVSELLYGAVALAQGLPVDHLVAHHRCPLVQLCLERHSASPPWRREPGGLALLMAERPAIHAVRGHDGPAVTCSVEPTAIVVVAGALLAELSAGRYQAPTHRWEPGGRDAGLLSMALTNDLDHDTPLDVLRRRDPAAGPATGDVASFLAAAAAANAAITDTITNAALTTAITKAVSAAAIDPLAG